MRSVEGETEAAAPRFRTPWRPLTCKLARAIAAELSIPQAPVSSGITMIVGKDDNQADGRCVTERGQAETAWIFHCAGDTYGVVLGDLLELSYSVKVKEYNGLYLKLGGRLPAGPLSFSVEQVRARLRRRWNQFERWFDMGSFQSHLPLEVRRASIIEAFNIEEFLSIFSGREVVEVESQ